LKDQVKEEGGEALVMRDPLFVRAKSDIGMLPLVAST
jgi:hypothetical protein